MQEFHASAQPTLGVEWEVALIDPVTRDLVSRAADVVALVQAEHPEIHLEREFLANTVELVTPVCHTVPEAVASLRVGCGEGSGGFVGAETVGFGFAPVL